MPIIVSLSGVFAVPMFRSCRRLGLAVSLALFTSGLLAAEVDSAHDLRLYRSRLHASSPWLHDWRASQGDTPCR